MRSGQGQRVLKGENWNTKGKAAEGTGNSPTSSGFTLDVEDANRR